MKSVVLKASRNSIKNIKHMNFEDAVGAHLPSPYTLVLAGSFQLKKNQNHRILCIAVL